MVKFDLIFSAQEPNASNCVWAKPIQEGFVLYLFNAGRWAPLITVDDKGTPTVFDDEPVKVSSKANKTSNSAIDNEFAALGKDGNLKRSGKYASSFEPAGTAAELIAQAVIGQAGGITYKGLVESASQLPEEPENGWQYVASAAFTYGSTEVAVGDYLIYNASSELWDVINKQI